MSSYGRPMPLNGAGGGVVVGCVGGVERALVDWIGRLDEGVESVLEREREREPTGSIPPPRIRLRSVNGGTM